MSCRLVHTWLLVLVAMFANASTGAVDSLLLVNKQPSNVQVEQLYNQQLRYNKDSAYVLKQLNTLVSFAEKQGNMELLSLGTTILADHYARIRQFNPLSTELHKKAVAIAVQSSLPLAEGMATYKLGRYCYSFKQYPQAFEHLLKAKAIFESIVNDKVPEITDFYFYMGSLYREIGDLDEALSYFQKINNYSTSTNKQHWFIINTFDNIALIYQKKKLFDSAIAYFHKTAEAARQYNFTDWEGLCMGNIGKMYFEKGMLEQAYPYLRTGANKCYLLKDFETASNYRSLMVKYHLARGETVEAETIFKQMDTVHEHRSAFEVKMDYYQVLALLQEAKGQAPQAILSWKMFNVFKDSTAKLYDEKALHNIQIRLQTTAYLAQLREVETTARQKLLTRNIVLASAFVLVVLCVLLYFRERGRRKLEKDLFAKRQQLLNEQKQHAQNELAAAQMALQKFTENIREKNELIQQVNEEIESLRQSQELGHDDQLRLTHQLHQKTILTPNEWHEFKQLFDKVHPGFFIKLKDRYPQFTQSEVRLLALIKLKMETADMCAMLGVSPDAIKKTRYRVRRKVSEEDNFNLDVFVMDI